MENNTLQANKKNVSTGTDEKQLVVFKLKNEEFGIYIESVREIVRVPEITQLPRAPEFLWGISNLRGDIMPIIDTRKRFSMPETQISERARVLVVDIDGVSSGLVVDEVNEVMRVPKNAIDNPPAAVKGIDKHFLEGIVKADGGKRVIMTLNLEEILCTNADKNTSGSMRYAGNVNTEDTTETIEEEQIISLKISNEEYGFFISQVREIRRFTDVTEVPNAPSYVKGLITVRNNLLPILDMRSMLGKKAWVEELSELFKSKIERCALWEENLEHCLEAGSHVFNLVSSEECEFGKWLNSPDELPGIINDALKDLRSLHDELHKTGRTTLNLINVSLNEARRYYKAHVEKIKHALGSSLKNIISLIEDSLREEQRILVIETGGITAGLLVDTVNEVIRIPRKIIEKVSMVGTSTSKDLRGVAKLDNGQRLIMILDESSLISAEDVKLIEELERSSAECSGNAKDTKKSSDKGGDKDKLNEDVELLEKLGAEGSSGSDTCKEEADMRNKTEKSEEQLVTFNLGNEEFGLRITDVQEINRLAQITQLPKSPPFVEGVTNLRGDVVPVIDLRKRFNMPPVERDDRTRIIITDIGGRKTGLIVDKVNEVMRIPGQNIESADKVVAGMIDADFVEGIGKINDRGRMIIMLNTEKILTQNEVNLLRKFTDEKEKPKSQKGKKSSTSKKKKQTKTGR